ncbi:hypothetical protein [Bacteroides reticulotermitis]|uniref:hypothetical protein n=1 Tax=Bacteroides reticulotermitis TaxID=1133319 RepID=UPI003A88C3FE
MIAEERKLHKLKLIKTLIDSPRYEYKELLTFYAFYISNTPDTLYNISYYTDRIDDFIKKIGDLPEKVKWLDSLFEKIKIEIDSHPLKDKFVFIFDDLFAYTTNSFDIKEENVDAFRLDLVTRDKFSLRMRIGKSETDFFFEYPNEKHKDIDTLISNIKDSILKHDLSTKVY